MDLTLILFIVGALIAGVILVLAYILLDKLYPPINEPNISAGTVNDGLAGEAGAAGFGGAVANAGRPGLSGNTGVVSRSGRHGTTGAEGAAGASGAVGFAGHPGVTGEKGDPSNIDVPSVVRNKIPRADSYVLNDLFSFENRQYQASMYASIENNSRFILDSGVQIEEGPTTGWNTGLTLTAGPASLFTGNVDGGTFQSNLRIAICQGRGRQAGKDRSDDDVIYVSPPIARRSYLFKYITQKPIPDNFSEVDTSFPIAPLGNSDYFLYFRTTLPTTGALTSQNASRFKYHLYQGLGKYELVVNTFPPLPGEYSFNYRIIEEFTRIEDREFLMPSATLPFNVNVLKYINSTNDQTTRYLLAISNRFDLNKVVERSYSFKNEIWRQTNRKVVQVAHEEPDFLVPFDNTFQTLANEKALSDAALAAASYWTFGGTPTLTTDNKNLTLDYTIIDGTVPEYTSTLVAGLRNYVPAIPLNKFSSGDKLYIEFNINVRSAPPTVQLLRTFRLYYGREFSFDSIDFKAIYAKTIYFCTTYAFTLSGSEITNIQNGRDIGSSDDYLELDLSSPVTIGYTSYIDKSRFSTKVMFQLKSSSPPVHFINIPLYGYKKE